MAGVGAYALPQILPARVFGAPAANSKLSSRPSSLVLEIPVQNRGRGTKDEDDKRELSVGEQAPRQVFPDVNPVLTICPLAKVPALFYEQRRVGLGEELLDEVEALLQFIRAHTELGRQGLHGTRSFPTKRAHGELAAERMVAQGLVALGLEGQRLVEKPKGMAEKQVLAWWLRQRTTAGRRWVSKRWWMGEESGVSKAIRLVKESRAGKMNRLKQRLLKGLHDGGEKENKLVREYHYPRPDPVRHERRNAAQVGHAF